MRAFNLFHSVTMIIFIVSTPLRAQDTDIPPVPPNAMDSSEAAQAVADRTLMWDRIKTGVLSGAGVLVVFGVPAYMLSIKNRDRADKEFQTCMDKEIELRDRDYKLRKLREYKLVKDVGFAREVNWDEVKKLDPPLRELYVHCWKQTRLGRSILSKPKQSDYHNDIQKQLEDYELERTGAGERQRVGDGGFHHDGQTQTLPPPLPPGQEEAWPPIPGGVVNPGRPRTNAGQVLAPQGPGTQSQATRSKNKKKKAQPGNTSGNANAQAPVTGSNSKNTGGGQGQGTSGNNNHSPPPSSSSPNAETNGGGSGAKTSSNGSPVVDPNSTAGQGRRKRKGSGSFSHSTPPVDTINVPAETMHIPVTVPNPQARTGRRRRTSAGGAAPGEETPDSHVVDRMPVGSGLIHKVDNAWQGVVQKATPLVNNAGGFIQELGQELPRSMSRYFGPGRDATGAPGNGGGGGIWRPRRGG